MAITTMPEVGLLNATTTTAASNASTLHPSLSYATHLALTIVYICIYGALFLFVYCQLWMILYYRHRRWSYQTVFLFLCLIWAAFRVVLFSNFFQREPWNTPLAHWMSWILESCPVLLQFTTLVLLVAFFSQVS